MINYYYCYVKYTWYYKLLSATNNIISIRNMAVKNHRQQPRTHDSNNQIGSHHDTLL